MPLNRKRRRGRVSYFSFSKELRVPGCIANLGWGRLFVAEHVVVSAPLTAVIVRNWHASGPT